MDPLLTLIATACIVVLLLHAAAAKLIDRADFRRHLHDYRVPGALADALSWALPVAEAALAIGLVSPARAWVAWVAAAWLVMYALAMAWQLIQGRRLDCGCGGAPLQVSWWLVARNAVLAALAAFGGADLGSARALGAADLAVAAAAVLLATLLYAAFNQCLRQRPAQPSQGTLA